MSKRLEAQVWSLDNCSGCGMCVAACSKQVLRWDGEEHPYLEKRTKTVGMTRMPLDTCSICEKFCEASCPRLAGRMSPLEAQVYLAARSLGPVKSGAPNDVIRSILAAGAAPACWTGWSPWTWTPGSSSRRHVWPSPWRKLSTASARSTCGHRCWMGLTRPSLSAAWKTLP